MYLKLKLKNLNNDEILNYQNKIYKISLQLFKSFYYYHFFTNFNLFNIIIKLLFILFILNKHKFLVN